MDNNTEQYIELDYNIHKKGKMLITSELLDQLTYEQFYALRYIYNKKRVTSGDVARVLFVNKSTISILIRRMENKGLIFRKQPETDRRKIYLLLSDKGKQLYEDCHQKINALVKEIMQVFSETDIERLLSLNQKIDQLFNEKLLAKGIEE
ncbi:MAG: MarR family transcriptional regulator [Sporolactobacillus sp.]|nr:MarR family transcriptional regulator [Sporolactobacillus sp.]MCI1882314.1 MarR family transcriptional regulator [Sporolactobacillus sp.]